MKIGNASIEQAEARVEAEKEASVRRIQAAARGPVGPDPAGGPLICDCGEPIGEARRAAVPGTRFCIDCATYLERRRHA